MDKSLTYLGGLEYDTDMSQQKEYKSLLGITEYL